MSEILKVKVQDENGNVFYIHTSADVVFCADGTSVQDRLGQKLDKSVIIQNATTAATDKVPSAAVAKDLQDQINQQNTNISRKVTVNTNLVTSSDIACYKRGNIVYLCGNVNIKNAGQNQIIATLQDNIASGVSYFPAAGYSGKCGEGQIEKNSLKISVPAAGYYRFSCWYVTL